MAKYYRQRYDYFKMADLQLSANKNLILKNISSKNKWQKWQTGRVLFLQNFSKHSIYCRNMLTWGALRDLVSFAEFKNVKNTPSRVLLLVKLEAEACNFSDSNTSPWVFFKYLR